MIQALECLSQTGLYSLVREYQKGKYDCTVCFYLQNRLIQTSQTGGQWYSDSSPLSIPWPGQEPTLLKNLSDAPLKDGLLALPQIID